MNEVKLIGIIGGEQGIDVDSIINSWDLAAEEILLCIDSQGGSVSHGFRLYDHIETMRSKGQKVHAKIIGECYSIATVVACACDDVAMNKYGLFMIHSPTISVEDATSDDLRKCAEMTDKVTDNIAQVYAKKTGRTKEEMLTLMQKTAFYNSKEAQDMKLIDRIYNALGEIRNKWNHFHMAAQVTEAEAQEAEAKVNEIKQEMAAEESCAEKPKIETEPDNMEVGEVQPDWQQKFNELQAKMVKLEAEYASITQTLNKVAVSNVADDIKLKNLAGKIEAPPAKELREKQPVRTNRF